MFELIKKKATARILLWRRLDVTTRSDRSLRDWLTGRLRVNIHDLLRKVTKQRPRVLINIHEHTFAVVGLVFVHRKTQFMMGLIQSAFAAEGGYHVHAVSATFIAVKYTV